MGVPERGTINIGTPLAHPHHDYVNVERRVSRLRIHLAPGRKLLPLLHRADVICALYLKDRNKYSRRYKYMKLISRAQFLLCTSLGKLGKQYKRSYNRGGGQCGHLLQTIICIIYVCNFIALIFVEIVFKTN